MHPYLMHKYDWGYDQKGLKRHFSFSLNFDIFLVCDFLCAAPVGAGNTGAETQEDPPRSQEPGSRHAHH